jgi:hypothetical protein
MWTVATILAALVGWHHDARRIEIPIGSARCQEPAARFYAGGIGHDDGVRFELCRDGRVWIFDHGAQAAALLAPSVFEPMLAEVTAPEAVRELRESYCHPPLDCWVEVDLEIGGGRLRRNIAGCANYGTWVRVATQIFGILIPGYDPFARPRRHRRW